MIITVLAYAAFAAGYFFACFAWVFSRNFEQKPRSVFRHMCRWGRNITMICGVLSVLWFGSAVMTLISLLRAGVSAGESVFVYTLIFAIVFAGLEVMSWLAYRRYNKAIVNTLVPPESQSGKGKRRPK